MAHKMHFGISEMHYVLSNGLPEHLNGNCFPPSLKLDQADGGFLVEPLLFIPGEAINLFLQLVSYTLWISQAPGRGFCLSMS